MDFLESIKPCVPKPWLHLTAGVMWSGVGIFLNTLAYDWLIPVSKNQVIFFVFFGILMAAIIYKFGFSKLAKENINRVEALTAEKSCLFAFQKWTSYPLIVVMIALGIFLRKYTSIPKPYLAVMYIGIGGGLFLSSFLYYWHVWGERSKRSK